MCCDYLMMRRVLFDNSHEKSLHQNLFRIQTNIYMREASSFLAGTGTVIDIDISARKLT